MRDIRLFFAREHNRTCTNEQNKSFAWMSMNMSCRQTIYNCIFWLLARSSASVCIRCRNSTWRYANKFNRRSGVFTLCYVSTKVYVFTTCVLYVLYYIQYTIHVRRTCTLYDHNERLLWLQFLAFCLFSLRTIEKKHSSI